MRQVLWQINDPTKNARMRDSKTLHRYILCEQIHSIWTCGSTTWQSSVINLFSLYQVNYDYTVCFYGDVVELMQIYFIFILPTIKVFFFSFWQDSSPAVYKITLLEFYRVDSTQSLQTAYSTVCD